MNSTSYHFVRKVIRPLIPYPTKKTWRRWFPKFEDRNIAFILREQKIDTLIDVGANVGQFGTKMRSCGFRGRIISVEPVSEYHDLLCKTARNDPSWDVAPRMGLGSTCGEARIEIAGALSSFKEFVDNSKRATEIVPVLTLDEAFKQFHVPIFSRIGLKLDVQGFEKEVIDGASCTLNRVHAVLIELSLKPVYRGETYYIDILQILHDRGFEAVFFSPVVNQQTFGEMWQVDALLVRRVERRNEALDCKVDRNHLI